MKRLSCLALVIILLSACGSPKDPTETGGKPQAVADLQVNLDERSGDTIAQNKPFTYNVTVRNNGSDDAKGVKLTVTLPFPASDVPKECSSSDTTLECNLGDFEKGFSKDVLVSGQAAEEGTFSVSANVTADTRDPDLGNNSSSASFEVFTSTSAVPDLSGQVTGWNAATATLNAVFYGATAQPSKVASGTLAADKKLEVFLGKSVSADLLTQLPACPNLTQSNPAARQNSFSALEVRQDGKVVGRVALASQQSVLSKGLQTVGDYYVQQTYADAATTVTGSCALGGVVKAVFKYDLKLERGWNAVTFKLAAKNGDTQTLELSSGIPQGAAWFFTPVP